MMKILIIEDDPILSKILSKGFLKMGYNTDTALDGIDGEYMACINDYDVIILDLNLPRKDGLEVLKYIRREKPDQKIIILSARNDVEDRLSGLNFGANDYVGKPFDFRELEARVRALLRRNFVQVEPCLKIRGLKFDTLKKEVTFLEKPLKLSPKELSILEYLLYHQGEIISAEQIIEHVWNSDVDLFSLSIKPHISRLRKKILEQTGEEIIATVRGNGYMIPKEENK